MATASAYTILGLSPGATNEEVGEIMMRSLEIMMALQPEVAAHVR